MAKKYHEPNISIVCSVLSVQQHIEADTKQKAKAKMKNTTQKQEFHNYDGKLCIDYDVLLYSVLFVFCHRWCHTRFLSLIFVFRSATSKSKRELYVIYYWPWVVHSPSEPNKSTTPVSTLMPGMIPRFFKMSTNGVPSAAFWYNVSWNKITPEMLSFNLSLVVNNNSR